LFQLGLVVFAVALLAGTVVEKARMRDTAPAPAPAEAVTEAITVVDVAHGVDAAALGSLVRLRADERVVAVDDRPVANDLAAGAAIATRALGTGTYLDLTVAGASGRRRVLVLMH
jgi:S1-C subfamily serine protease